MDFTAIVELLNKGVELAKSITTLTGDLDASGILGFVSKFLENLDFSSLTDMILGIINIAK